MKTMSRHWLAVVAAVSAVLASTGARALDPGRPLDQLRHTGWSLGNGAPGNIKAIAQGRDGFLWLGTSTGLYRFDGIRFEPVAPEEDDPRRSQQITALLAARNGDIWVGYDFGGIARLRDGRLRGANPARPRGGVLALVEDRNGAIWVAANSAGTTILDRFAGGRWTRFDAARGAPAAGIEAIATGGDGSLYAAAQDGVYALRPGRRRFDRIGDAGVTNAALARGRYGEMWLADDHGLRPVDASRPILPVPAANAPYVNRQLQIDREGNIWIAGADDGLARRSAERRERGAITPSRMELFTDRQGLTGKLALSVFEDREGNIWVGTASGLDRFSASNVAQPASAETLLTGFAGQGAPDSIMVAGLSGLYRLAAPPAPPRLVLRRPGIGVLCGDARAIFAVNLSGAVVIRDGQTRAAARSRTLGGALPVTCTMDASGRVFASFDGLYTLDGTTLRRMPGLPGSSAGTATMLRSDGAGGLLAYWGRTGINHIGDGTVRTLLPSRRNAIGFVKTLVRTPYGFLAGGESGLARYDGRRSTFLTARRYPFLAGVTGIARTARGATWIIGASGIVRIPTAALEAAFHDDAASVPVVRFGEEEGFRARTDAYDTNDAVEDAAGRIWFVTNRGLAWIDPAALTRNRQPPPVVIRSLTANGVAQRIGAGEIRLPARTNRVQIAFAALSLTDATANRIRYRLQGVDAGWIDADRDRRATYTNLGPGAYVFQVVAANNDGLWNRTGARVALVIAPTFYQTTWFTGLLLSLAAAAAWLLYRRRVRIIAQRIRDRLQVQVAERERIARELHDTLLQGMQGLMLHFQAAADGMAPGTPARSTIERALERGDDVLLEGRDRVRDLRASGPSATLEARLAALIGEPMVPGSAAIALRTRGTPRAICAPVVEELAAIAGEALANARAHARAAHVEVEVDYGHHELVLTIEDDGIGLDAGVRAAGRREGHFGLVGMRERAAGIGGVLTIRSGQTGGVRVRVAIPAAVAYVPVARPRWPRRWRSQPSEA
jgi:signal transduction histidine kinase